MIPTADVADCPRAFRARIMRFFCSGENTGKIDAIFRLNNDRGIVQGIELISDQDALCVQADVMGDFLRHVLVVAGHDNYRNTILFE